MPIQEQALHGVCDRASLFALLRDALGWPVDPEDTFTYDESRVAGSVADRAEVSRLVKFHSDDPFAIFLIEFATEFKRGDLREILRNIKRDARLSARLGGITPAEIVFVCATEDYRGVRFARFEDRSPRQPKLSVFGWDHDQLGGTRTLREINLPALIMPPENVLGEYDWTQARWSAAWDVESVTKEFFQKYREVFGQVEAMVGGVTGDKRLFTQRLFNRLMFIEFLSRRDWLRYGGRTDYLAALYAAATASGENFYQDRLYWTFFSGLGVQAGKGANAQTHGMAELVALRGEVPFLNGGLFEMADADDIQGAVTIPNEAFALILDGLFARFNFTVTESTPLDVEVAVDPEMLGKVFEELVTGRHETGSYYTPRPIVAFMCREALKGYLGGHTGAPAHLAELVDERNADALSRADAAHLLDRLRSCKVVDPACGSGAYLLGMLQELFDLTGLLELRADPLSPKDKYQRKLRIIQNNLYGVDVDEFAVNIARLRLWLSLAVEFEGTTPEPLPNLDFKIEVGDSLSAPSPQTDSAQVSSRESLIRDYENAKADFGDPYYAGDKYVLRARITALKQDIADWTHLGQTVAGFDWRVEFAEVFQSGGFDIALANPPYVRQELIKEQKPTLKAVYPEVYAGTADLYCYFYARALQLLRPGGMLAFISPNKWFRAGYGANLRAHIAQTCGVTSITDFGDLPVFQAATTYPMIFIAQKGGATASETLLTEPKSLLPPYPDVLAVVQKSGQRLPVGALSGKNWTLSDAASAERIRKMKAAGVPLGEYVQGQIYRGVLTGLNIAFDYKGDVHDQLLAADPKSAELIKPLAVGRDIKRWAVNSTDKWMIVTPVGVNIKRYPAIFAHLKQWQTELEKRWDKGNHWWELRSCDYYAAFDKPKIVTPDIAPQMRFTIDASGRYFGNTAYFIPLADLFLLGLLNSQCVEGFYVEMSAQIRGGYLRFFRQYVEQIPVPIASATDRAAIATLVQKCLDAKGVGCEAWEREINGRVAALYGL